MSIEKERRAFEDWYKKNIGRSLVYKVCDQTYLNSKTQESWLTWQASASRDGYKLVPNNDINIEDIIWGKCSCGSSRSPIVSDREGYNLIHCFACGANKYIHEDY